MVKIWSNIKIYFKKKKTLFINPKLMLNNFRLLQRKLFFINTLTKLSIHLMEWMHYKKCIVFMRAI